MDLTNEWYTYEDAIDKTTCNKIVKLANKDFDKGTVHEDSSYKVTSTRVSDIFWTQEQWLYDLIWPYMEDANKQSGWQYEISGAEPLQITRYKKGGYYDFHKDGKSDNLSTFEDGKIRKLSMSILLNNSYNDGQFQFATLSPQAKSGIHTPKLNSTGSVIVFPSFMCHRVKPVTRGVRYSLVAWFVGQPFK